MASAGRAGRAATSSEPRRTQPQPDRDAMSASFDVGQLGLVSGGDSTPARRLQFPTPLTSAAPSSVGRKSGGGGQLQPALPRESARLRFDLERLQHKLQEKDRDLEVLRFGKQISTQKLELAKSQNTKLEERLRREKKAHDALKEAHSELRQALGEKEREIRQLHLQGEHAAQRESELKADVVARERRIGHLQSSLELAEASLHRPDHNEELHALQDKVSQLQQQLMQNSAELSNERSRAAKLQRQEGSLMKEVDALRDALQAQEEQSRQLAVDNEDKADHIANLEDRVAALRSGGQQGQGDEPWVEQLEDERRKNASLTSRLNSLQHELQSSRKSFEMMLGERKAALDAKDRAEEELLQYRSTHDRRQQELEGQVISLETKHHELSARNADAEEKWLTAERQIAVLVARNNQLVVMGDDASAKYERLKESVAEAEGRYKGQLATLQEDLDRLREANREYIEANKEVEGTVRVLQEQLHTKASDIAALESRISHLERQLRAADQRADHLQKANLEWQKTNEVLNSNLQNTLEQNHALETSKMDMIERLSTSFSIPKKALAENQSVNNENAQINTVRTAEALQDALAMNDATNALFNAGDPDLGSPLKSPQLRKMSNVPVMTELSALKQLVVDQGQQLQEMHNRFDELLGEHKGHQTNLQDIKTNAQDNHKHNYRALDNMQKAIRSLQGMLGDKSLEDASEEVNRRDRTKSNSTPVPMPIKIWRPDGDDDDDEPEDAPAAPPARAPSARRQLAPLPDDGSEESLDDMAPQYVYNPRSAEDADAHAAASPTSPTHSAHHSKGVLRELADTLGTVQEDQAGMKKLLQELHTAVKEARAEDVANHTTTRAKLAQVLEALPSEQKQMVTDMATDMAQRLERLSPEVQEQLKQVVQGAMETYFEEAKDKDMTVWLQQSITNIVKEEIVRDSPPVVNEIEVRGNNNTLLILGVVGMAMAAMYAHLTYQPEPNYYPT